MNNELNSATQPQAAMPEGWKLVPIEPTDEMVLAPGALRLTGNVARIHRNIYAAMLAAAPPSPQPVAESGNRALMDQWNEGAAMILALEALDVATTPLPEDRQTVLRAQSALRAALARHPTPAAALQPVAGLTDTHSEITPMFLLNVALCIENHDTVATSMKREILAKLHRLSDELQAARMAKLTGQAGATGESK